jgi:hypothetical protein
MLKKPTRFLIALLILVELGATAISTMPARIGTVNAALESDMPVVFVDPPETIANVGDTVTISVKVFNLSGNFYPTGDTWRKGQPLPPLQVESFRYNYSLGYLYGMSISLHWNPTYLKYVSHTVTVPVDDHPGGVLNGPNIIMGTDNVDEAGGNYALDVASQAPADAFNCPDANATAFNITFTVIKNGKCDITLTNVDLVFDTVGFGFPFSVPSEIPHWERNGVFRTGNLQTSIDSVTAGALVEGSLFNPVIHGEDVTVHISMRNDNDTITDTYNLSLYDGATVLKQWGNEELSPGTAKMFNYTIAGSDVGPHTIKAEASILHGSDVRTDEGSKNITVIAPPDLQISGPESALTGQTVSFSASSSTPPYPDGSFTTYTWTLWAPGDPSARDTKTGQSVDFELPPETAKTGNWTVMLVVKDNYGITANQKTGTSLKPTTELRRPATTAYRKTAILNVQAAGAPGLNIEWILLIVILIVIIALAVFYMRRRSR